MVDHGMLETFIDAVKQDVPDKNHTYHATVSRVDNEGRVWVSVAGSETETPTESSASEVQRGDAVTVEWRNNKLYIAGNYTNPSAGVARVSAVEDSAARAFSAASSAEVSAMAAQSSAETASSAAAQAVSDAATAKTTTDEIVAYAQTAGKTVTQILTDGETAGAAAQAASQAANSALVNLSTVEDVVGVLNWITAHGTMTSQSGQTFDANKVYFVLDDITPGDYHVGSHYYAIVTEPVAAQIANYYCLSVDESVQNYVATHLCVDSEGLWLIPDANSSPSSSGKKILIATGAGTNYSTAGTYIIDGASGSGAVLAQFLANKATVGSLDEARMEVDETGLHGYNSNSVTFFDVDYDGASISSNALKTVDRYGLDSIPAGQTSKTFIVLLGNVVSGSTITLTLNSWRKAIDSYGVLLDLEPDVQTETNMEVVRYAYGGLKLFVPSANNNQITFTVGTSGTFTASCQLYQYREFTLDIEITFSYDASNSTITVTYDVASDYAEPIDRTLGFGYVEIDYVTFTTAPSFMFGSKKGDLGAFAGIIGESLYAEYANQIAIGKYNDNAPTNAFEIGNGTSNNARSNALTVEWNGNVETAGDIEDGSGNVLADKADTATVTAALAGKVDMTTPECNLNISATAGTTDGDLYAAITALGWESEVID